jgi:hypothetical protein
MDAQAILPGLIAPPPKAETRFHGIRHHGPGSAASMLKALDAFRPDAILIEGPEDLSASLLEVVLPGTKPPVALMAWDISEPGRAAFLPFAEFSPEYQALLWADARGVDARFIDLPFGISLALDKSGEEGRGGRSGDPLSILAEAAGYDDGERWWDAVVESGGKGTGGDFDAVEEAMAEMRRECGVERIDELREAWMRRAVAEEAARRPKGKISVVCGAWHVPGLRETDSEKIDLSTLPTPEKIGKAWTPWSYENLSSRTYGAGVRSPAWYATVWETVSKRRRGRNDDGAAGRRLTIAWTARVARILRSLGHEASAAGATEAALLAETLASMRGRAAPSPEDMDDACLAAMAQGVPRTQALLSAIHVPDIVGTPPPNGGTSPIRIDLDRRLAETKIRPSSRPTRVRTGPGMTLSAERSALLHSLRILDVPLCSLESSAANGTKETWVVAWTPETESKLAEVSVRGAAVAIAAETTLLVRAAAGLEETCLAIADALTAELLGSLDEMTAMAEKRAADCSDPKTLAAASAAAAGCIEIASSKNIDESRRKKAMVLAETLSALAAFRFPEIAADALPDEAEEISATMEAAAGAAIRIDVAVGGGRAAEDKWMEALRNIADARASASFVAGTAARILHDRSASKIDVTERRLRSALSDGEPENAALWLGGFLRGSAAALLADAPLLSILRKWLLSMDEGDFANALPSLRKAFSSLPEGERRTLLRAARGSGGPSAGPRGTERDEETEREALLVAKLILFGKFERKAK